MQVVVQCACWGAAAAPPTPSAHPSTHPPVIARSGSTGWSSARDSRAVMIVQPAEGPSLGVAPAGGASAGQQREGAAGEWTRLVAGWAGAAPTGVHSPGRRWILDAHSCNMEVQYICNKISWIVALCPPGPVQARTRGDVQVDGVVCKEGGPLWHSLLQELAGVGVGNGGTFLHHIAQLACRQEGEGEGAARAGRQAGRQQQWQPAGAGWGAREG